MEDVRDVMDEVDGPGVDCGDDAMGGGVTDTDRCMVAMLMVGRWLVPEARQKDEGRIGGAVMAW